METETRYMRRRKGERYEDVARGYCDRSGGFGLMNMTECTAILRKAMLKYDMSARAYDRILKVARTIADLDASEAITPDHMREAISYRNLDRSSWGMRF